MVKRNEELFNSIVKEILDSRKSENDSSTQIIDYRTFIVYTNNITCKKLGHTLSRASAVVKICQNSFENPFIQLFEIPVCECNKCRALYISESTYEELKSKGNIMAQLLSQEEFDGGTYDDNRAEHIMYKCGYNVKANGLSSTQRHILLTQIIQSGVVSKAQAVNHLKNLIHKNRFRNNMSNAISKWEEDIEFLTGQRPALGVKIIIISKDIKQCNMNNYPY